MDEITRDTVVESKEDIILSGNEDLIDDEPPFIIYKIPYKYKDFTEEIFDSYCRSNWIDAYNDNCEFHSPCVRLRGRLIIDEIEAETRTIIPKKLTMEFYDGTDNHECELTLMIRDPSIL